MSSPVAEGCFGSARSSDGHTETTPTKRTNFGKRYLGWQELQDLGSSQRGGKLDDHRREARAKACQLIHGTAIGFVREKIASGIILVRTPEQTMAANDRSGGRSEYQAILVKGRLSYAFCEFVHGKYDRDKLDTVRQLIRNMTIEERLTIASLNFEEIWSRMWARKHMRTFSWREGGMSHAHKLRILREGWPPVDLQRDTLYVHRREKFHAAWLVDQKSSQLLKSLLNEMTGVGQGRWEYPKGKRLDRSESDLSCAIREFREETQIPFENIRILPGFDRVEKYVHMNVLYINTFYLAVVDAPFGDPSKFIRLSNIEQTSEVSDIAWMGLADMRRVCGPAGRDLIPMGRAAFRYVRDYNRGKAPRLYVPPAVPQKRTSSGHKGRPTSAPTPPSRASRASAEQRATAAQWVPAVQSPPVVPPPDVLPPVARQHAARQHAARPHTARQTPHKSESQTAARRAQHKHRSRIEDPDEGWQLVTRRGQPARTKDGCGGERQHRPSHGRPGQETV